MSLTNRVFTTTWSSLGNSQIRWDAASNELQGLQSSFSNMKVFVDATRTFLRHGYSNLLEAVGQSNAFQFHTPLRILPSNALPFPVPLSLSNLRITPPPLPAASNQMFQGLMASNVYANEIGFYKDLEYMQVLSGRVAEAQRTVTSIDVRIKTLHSMQSNLRQEVMRYRPQFSPNLNFAYSNTLQILTSNGIAPGVQTVRVTVANGKFLLNNRNNSPFIVEPWNTYVFDQTDPSNATHPFRLSVTPDGVHSGGTLYATKVTYTPTRVTLQVWENTPLPLFYYCANHAGMGGSMTSSNLVTAPPP